MFAELSSPQIKIFGSLETKKSSVKVFVSKFSTNDTKRENVDGDLDAQEFPL